MPDRRNSGGSRFLYEPFDATSARVDAHEKIMEARWTAVEQRLAQMEATLDRFEKRLWLAAAGLAAFLATSMGESFIATHF